MLPRSSSTSSCLQTLNENIPSINILHHYESLQNLPQSKSSHPLSVDNNHLNLPIVSHRKNDQQSDQLRQTIVRDDIENIQERLHGMIIGVPSTDDEHPKTILTQQKSTTEYFTPKISTEDEEDEFDRKKILFR